MTDKSNKETGQRRKSDAPRAEQTVPSRDDFTPCEDERYLLDPGGGLALAEDLELDEETPSWRRKDRPPRFRK
jgi:hypothetical protein